MLFFSCSDVLLYGRHYFPSDMSGSLNIHDVTCKITSTLIYALSYQMIKIYYASTIDVNR